MTTKIITEYPHHCEWCIANNLQVIKEPSGQTWVEWVEWSNDITLTQYCPGCGGFLQ